MRWKCLDVLAKYFILITALFLCFSFLTRESENTLKHFPGLYRTSKTLNQFFRSKATIRMMILLHNNSIFGLNCYFEDGQDKLHKYYAGKNNTILTLPGKKTKTETNILIASSTSIYCRRVVSTFREQRWRQSQTDCKHVQRRVMQKSNCETKPISILNVIKMLPWCCIRLHQKVSALTLG